MLQGSHSAACQKVFEPYLTKLKIIAKEKSFGSLSDKEIDQPWTGADWRTMTGSHGFSVPFSRKKDSDPFPIVPCYLMLSKPRGSKAWTAERHDFSWKDLEHSISSLGVERCLKIFYHCSYTPAAANMVGYLNLQAIPRTSMPVRVSHPLS